jgi:hypothetical protein
LPAMLHRRHCLARNIRIKLPGFASWENFISFVVNKRNWKYQLLAYSQHSLTLYNFRSNILFLKLTHRCRRELRCRDVRLRVFKLDGAHYKS